MGNTTRKMPQEHYEALLLERGHSRRRRENQEADELTIKDIDRDEVFRIVGIIRSMGRLSGPVGKSLPDVLDRLGLRKNGKLRRTCLIAAVLLATGCAHPSCLHRDTSMLGDQPEKPRGRRA